MYTIKLKKDASVKKADWEKIETLPQGPLPNTFKAATGHIFRLYPATWTTPKSIVCQTSAQFQSEIKV